jgi:hypothetical protein
MQTIHESLAATHPAASRLAHWMATLCITGALQLCITGARNKNPLLQEVGGPLDGDTCVMRGITVKPNARVTQYSCVHNK